MFALRWLGQCTKELHNSHHFAAAISPICRHATTPTNARGRMDLVALLVARVQQTKPSLWLNPLHQRNQQSMTRYILTALRCDPSASTGIAALEFFLDVGLQFCHLQLFSTAPASLMESEQAKLRHVVSSTRGPATSTWPLFFQCRLLSWKLRRPICHETWEESVQSICFGWFAGRSVHFYSWSHIHPHQENPPNIQVPPVSDSAQVDPQLLVEVYGSLPPL